MVVHNYGDNFYKSVSLRAEETADQVINTLSSISLQMKSIKDIGCGSGIWLKKFNEIGQFQQILGFDLIGAIEKDARSFDEKITFEAIDFENVVENIFPKTDLSLFLEVAEHLTENTAKKIIKFICETSNMVIFSAAIPGQGGYNHINEQLMSYWVKQIEINQFVVFDIFRKEMSKYKNLPFYYRNNIVLAISRKYYEQHQGDLEFLDKFMITSKSNIKDYRNTNQKIQYKIISNFNYKIVNILVSVKDYIFLKFKRSE